MIVRGIGQGVRMRPPRGATGKTTAQGQFCLGLLPFGPDPVHSRPLHGSRPPLAAAVWSTVIRPEAEGVLSERARVSKCMKEQNGEPIRSGRIGL